MSDISPRCHALVPCAGSGSRAGTAQPKQYQPLAGRPLVQHTLAALGAVARIYRLLVVVAPGDDTLRQPGARWQLADCGGATRAESGCNGLDHLRASGAAPRDWVLVHDAARCLLTPALVDALIDACLPDAVGGLLALPLPDTLKSASADSRVAATIDRADKWLWQTPQIFRIAALRDSYAASAVSAFGGNSDAASAIEAAGHAPLLVRGSAQNFKVTYPEDFALAEAILRSRGA